MPPLRNKPVKVRLLPLCADIKIILLMLFQDPNVLHVSEFESPSLSLPLQTLAEPLQINAGCLASEYPRDPVREKLAQRSRQSVIVNLAHGLTVWIGCL